MVEFKYYTKKVDENVQNEKGKEVFIDPKTSLDELRRTYPDGLTCKVVIK